MIDYHCHILPGLDDGSPNMEDAIEMARSLQKVGFTKVYCTPHCITGLYDISKAQLLDAVTRLQVALDSKDICLKLVPGMEYYVDDFFFDRLTHPVTLGDTNLLLFELPPNADVAILGEVVAQIKNRGLLPLLAHPERFFAADIYTANSHIFHSLWRHLFSRKHSSVAVPHALVEVINLGCFLQADIGSFRGIYGPKVKKIAFVLREIGAYSYYGTDGHNCLQLENILTNNPYLEHSCTI
ncbi:MAG: CpsB/CapC family capsule biosynthesis tyrosine phosphatase [Desulfuromonadaceae bacterium]|nr:CpsB/CapC family capsule biosynthesis tyrosine phosphatase [Desulfuromonadaceae bacterium]